MFDTLRNKQKPLFFVILLFALCFRIGLGQTTNLEVVRNVNLRPQPSISTVPIDLLRTGQTLELVELTKKNGYLHVRDADGEEGWVWAKNIRIVPAAESDLETLIPDAPALAASAATHISRNWLKPPLKQTIFQGIEGPCDPDGNGFDPVQFTLKNRADTPDVYHDVTWAAINELDFPGKANQVYAPPHRKDWNLDQLGTIEPYEGIPVRVAGYIVAIKPQNGGSGEGTNCKFNKVGDVDTHLALVLNIGDAESSSIIIEWTPRFLKAHPKWTKTRLLPWLDSDRPVRISGFLMVDPDHVNHLRKYRGTLWEIHPITKFEVFQNGQFVNVDQLP